MSVSGFENTAVSVRYRYYRPTINSDAADQKRAENVERDEVGEREFRSA